EWPYPPNRAQNNLPFVTVQLFPLDEHAHDPSVPSMLGGSRQEGRFLEMDRFFDLGRQATREGHIQFSKRIDAQFARPLFHLPTGVLGSVAEPTPSSMAQRDLLRQLALGLPAGQAVAFVMREVLGSMEVLGDADLSELHDWPCLQHSTPLGYYILKEAA